MLIDIIDITVTQYDIVEIQSHFELLLVLSFNRRALSTCASTFYDEFVVPEAETGANTRGNLNLEYELIGIH